MIDDLELEAYVDGELAGERLDAVKAAVAADPALAAKVEAHRRLRARLAQAFDGVLEEPAPAELIAASRGVAAPVRSRPRFGLPAWAAMAASLAAGVVLGQALIPEPYVASHNGAPVARGKLAKTLQRGLAGEPGVIAVGLSFRTRDGRYCRTFRSDRDHLQGLACRDAGRWVVALTTAEGARSPAGTYRQAGSETAPAVLAAVDRLIEGQPLDRAGERAARDRGWRR